jgi:hypothetical protein
MSRTRGLGAQQVGLRERRRSRGERPPFQARQRRRMAVLGSVAQLGEGTLDLGAPRAQDGEAGVGRPCSTLRE